MTVRFAQRAGGLRLNLLLSIGGNILFAGGQWIALVLLARLTDASTVGRYVLALGLTAPLFLFSNLQLREVQATDQTGQTSFGSFLSARVSTAALALLACVPLALVVSGDPTTRWIIFLTAAAKALDAVVDIYYGAWLRDERQPLVARSLAWRGATTAAIMGAALLATHSLFVVSIASVLQSTTMLVHASLVQGGVRLVALTKRDWKGLAGFIPLGLAVAFDSLAVNVPRLFIERSGGLALVGVFGAIGTFMQLGGSTVAVGLSQVGIPRLAKLFSAGDAQGFVRLLSRLLAAGLALGIAGLAVSLIAGEDLLRLAFGASYAPYANVLQWTMLNALVWYVGGILACAVTAARNFRVQLPIFAAAVAGVTLTSFLFVPKLGLVGASLAILTGFIVRGISNGIVVLRAIRTL